MNNYAGLAVFAKPPIGHRIGAYRGDTLFYCEIDNGTANGFAN